MGAGLGSDRSDTWAYVLGYAAAPFVLAWGLLCGAAGAIWERVKRQRKGDRR